MVATGRLIVLAGSVLGQDGADAVEVHGERIVRIGAHADLLASRASGTVVVGDGTGLLCPGFHEAHGHLVHTGLAAHELDLAGVAAAGLEEALRLRRARRPGDDWLVANGLPPGTFETFEAGPRALLDAWLPDKPVLIRAHDQHAVFLNTAGLDRIGLLGGSFEADPAYVERDADDAPTGRLLEDAAWEAERRMAASRDADRLTATRDAVRALHAAGIVAFHEMSGSRDHETLRALDAAGDLRLDVFATLSEPDIDNAARRAPGDRLRVVGIKLFLDGALGSRTAALLEPYEGMDDHRGLQTLPFEHALDAVRRAAAVGLPGFLHAIGDAAVRTALDVFAYQRTDGGPFLRHRVEHAQLIHGDDLPRFAELDVIASLQPIHLADDAPWVHRLLGDRSHRAFPLRRLTDAGVRVALGSDTPIETFDVIEGIRCATRRVGRDGTELHPEEALTIEETLHGYTAGAAYAAGVERDFGTISEGRLASLTLLSHDIVRTPDALADCRVTGTLVRGEVVHQADPA